MTDIEKKEEKRTAITLLKDPKVLEKFNELLGKRAPSFLTTVMGIVVNNTMLKDAEPNSVYSAAVISATLDLPINQNLGFAYIVPYKNRKTGKTEAQFQMGYKGFIQLALRSRQFKTINVTPIFEGQIIEENPLTGQYVFDRSIKSEKVVGYASYFELLNGFQKTLYMTTEQLTKHGSNYSQSFKKGFGLWKDNFGSMATKTVLKLLLSRYAPLSIDMQKAVIADQGVLNDENLDDIEYVDNQKEKLTNDETDKLIKENFTDKE